MTQAQQFLDAAYEQLDFIGGDLVASDLSPSDSSWVEKGDWAALTKHVRADKIFFVQGNPVVVFAKEDSGDPDSLRTLFNHAWCMSRPNLLFLATPGELAVYDLTEPPKRNEHEWMRFKPLNVVTQVSEVASALKAYHRGQIESGRLFEERRFGTSKGRADRSLIEDLRRVRASLMTAGLSGDKLKYAHALIGRSIFVRYLEDRKILTPEYFGKVAGNNQKWRAILKAEPSPPYADPDMASVCYLKVLDNRDFTYALFRQLADDFNGDMFPKDAEEQRVVEQKHLSLLQGFLRGDPDPQQKLFFWAYRFDIIPIELVSSIYEEFYTTKNEGKDGNGTHYTPSALVEFLLSQVLTSERLATDPVVLDPACGSGIFLVEAFRRIVRHRVHRQEGRRLTALQLRKILREQIRGIDINKEAIRVAAFSLYLALLHYQRPPDILEQIQKGHRLPYLIKQEKEPASSGGSETFDILEANNAFSKSISMKADVVAGNPPWGHVPRSDQEGREEAQVALDWCESRELPVGYRERSQAFIWRTLDFMKDDGCAGLLVSSGVLHKSQDLSREFRKEWLKQVSLLHVAHFALVRDVFFANSVAPFAAVTFEKVHPAGKARFQYSSAKMSRFVDTCQAVVFGSGDIHWLRQDDFLNSDKLWKTYWLGGHHDANLVAWLRSLPALQDLSSVHPRLRTVIGRGFEKHGGKLKPADWLRRYKALPTDRFTRCDPVDSSILQNVPDQVYRLCNREICHGLRILLLQGIQEAGNPKGQIFSRLEEKEYCFEKSIYGVKMPNAALGEHEVVLGILWSSLTRYYFYLTGAQWGTWCHQVLLDELREMPIQFPKDKKTERAVLDAVRCLSESYSLPLSNAASEAASQRALDEAVFDAYGLSTGERDLIRDTCEVGIPFFYDSVSSPGARTLDLSVLPTRSGMAAGLSSCPDNRTDIRGYLETFLHIWNREFEPDGGFSWRVIAPGHANPMLAVVFSTQPKGQEPQHGNEPDEQAWKALLGQLEKDLRVPFHSNGIYIDGLVRAVSSTQIVIIKRNEGRFWTRSAAREDAEATLLKATQLDGNGGLLA